MSDLKPITFRMPGITERLVARLREYARYIDENAENIVGTVEGRRMLDEHGLHISFEVSRTGYKLHVDHDWIVDGEELGWKD